MIGWIWSPKVWPKYTKDAEAGKFPGSAQPQVVPARKLIWLAIHGKKLFLQNKIKVIFEIKCRNLTS